MYNLMDRNVLLGVTGSIAVYKASDLASKLTQAGARVEVVMTPEAERFVSGLTFLGVTGRPPYTDMFDVQSGAAELHIELARRADVMVIAPATATTMARLGVGGGGGGLLSEVDTIMGAVRYVRGRGGDLAEKKVVVSAGGTQEPIDPVRFVGNHSSGKMGFAGAEAARDRRAAGG